MVSWHSFLATDVTNPYARLCWSNDGTVFLPPSVRSRLQVHRCRRVLVAPRYYDLRTASIANSDRFLWQAEESQLRICQLRVRIPCGLIDFAFWIMISQLRGRWIYEERRSKSELPGKVSLLAEPQLVVDVIPSERKVYWRPGIDRPQIGAGCCCQTMGQETS